MTRPVEIREKLIEFFRSDIIGPMRGPNETIDERPSLRYSAGVLFPQQVWRNESAEVSGRSDDSAVVAEDDDAPLPEAPPDDETRTSASHELHADDVDYDEAVTLANSFKPAALGLSFACDSRCNALLIEARAAIYESEVTHPPTEEGPKTDGKRAVAVTRWRRIPLDIAPFELAIAGKPTGVTQREVAPGLMLHVVVRPPSNGAHHCTATLFNSTTEHAKSKYFFQVGLAVRDSKGAPVFVEHHSADLGARDEEELGLAMLYRRRRTFAVGHGCAAEWDVAPGAQGASRVETAVLPAVRVPPILPTSWDALWLAMQFLSEGTDEDIVAELAHLPDAYERWVDGQAVEARTLSADFAKTAKAHLHACGQVAERIKRGIDLLRSDHDAMLAFKWMNRAMLTQQHHAKLRRELDDPWVRFPSTYESTWSESRTQGYWRTFQIAFVLMALPGLVPHAEASDRNIVDLIWFPTGGGKTEAYLGLSAFTIFRRRLADPSDDGCTILMRYTLRLLTSQQFQRAASLICACEIIRRAHVKKLGTAPVSVGLWVGQSLTPNDEDEALRLVNKMSRGPDARNKFQLLSCPWCGTRLDDRKRLGYLKAGGRMRFRCPARGDHPGQSGDACPFSESGAELPVTVVDESVYDEPPTLLIGTVDKFAMLPWREQSSALFGDGERRSPPDLVIQDELHLISGPLGSMVGLYEGMIDLLCTRNGRGPKIIASTATIRRAREQVRCLFNRDVVQFPPPGIDVADSFFAVEDPKADSRVYLGFLPTAASSPLTAQVRAVSALLQGLMVVSDAQTADSALDPYWTLVQYFSSLKELGRAATLVTADIPEYLPSMYRRYGVPPERSRRISRHEELTSRRREEEIPEILEELARSYSKARPPWEQALDTLLATNMISVGVDVDRLGLMMVVTQPKSTAEYIQASSRVGRSAAAPGFVLTLYNAGRPRDRSHYEQFRSYHEAFYRFVEPTSVTPFAAPALERALHAVMVIAARHLGGVPTPTEMDFSNAGYARAIEFMRARVADIDEDHLPQFDRVLRDRQREWASWGATHWGAFGPIGDHPLMIPAGKDAPPEFVGMTWQTPTSMRNVDVECAAVVCPDPEVTDVE